MPPRRIPAPTYIISSYLLWPPNVRNMWWVPTSKSTHNDMHTWQLILTNIPMNESINGTYIIYGPNFVSDPRGERSLHHSVMISRNNLQLISYPVLARGLASSKPPSNYTAKHIEEKDFRVWLLYLHLHCSFTHTAKVVENIERSREEFDFQSQKSRRNLIQIFFYEATTDDVPNTRDPRCSPEPSTNRGWLDVGSGSGSGSKSDMLSSLDIAASGAGRKSGFEHCAKRHLRGIDIV
ncbi:hypothetical protein B0H14DRAFT_2556113 [Mycena olivaceomarginata]|nr:hypothetical protein B0H14DRAFT_2556113 [Mycena olivaceomarginata]